MASRYLIPVAVFVIGFGLGYGITWVLVGSPPEPVAASGEATLATAANPPLPESDSSALTQWAKPPRQEAVSPDFDEAGGAGEPGRSDEAGGADDDRDPGSAAGDEPEAGGGDGGDDASAGGEPDPEESKWWDECVDRTCKIYFGGVTGGLSIRRGKVPHGRQMNWKAEFGESKKVDYLPTLDGLKAEIKGIAIGGDGKPSAAEIVWKKDNGARVQGVIALNLGGKRVRMEPVK